MDRVQRNEALKMMKGIEQMWYSEVTNIFENARDIKM